MPRAGTYFASLSAGSQECDKAHGETDGALDEDARVSELCGSVAFLQSNESEGRAIRLG
ncbi:hypothetical protein [Piscirickettsia salmonis]|uniref:hypothetical protein n=1 Tax=Piscirickettsia salmonis TaxID=1238 RepID=UPI0012FF1856